MWLSFGYCAITLKNVGHFFLNFSYFNKNMLLGGEKNNTLSESCDSFLDFYSKIAKILGELCFCQKHQVPTILTDDEFISLPVCAEDT